MTRSIAFLLTPDPDADNAHNDNHERLPGAFQRAGWQVFCAPHQSLSMRGNDIHIDAENARKFDLIWPVGFGPKRGFMDRLHLLSQLPRHKLINATPSWITLHGKAAFADLCAPGLISADRAALQGHYEQNPGQWVLKPLAGSFGRGVTLIETPAHLRALLHASQDAWWMLQRFIPEAADGELRSLICGERLIGSYLRRPGDQLPANLAAGGVASPGKPDPEQTRLVETVHRRLLAQGVGFAAIDTVGEYLMEVNVANPGGLQTLQRLYAGEPGYDAMHRVVQSVDQLVSQRSALTD